jgi:pyruvate dehydrogenase E2 component (dihydrolipoamide acetyltransferase)
VLEVSEGAPADAVKAPAAAAVKAPPAAPAAPAKAQLAEAPAPAPAAEARAAPDLAPDFKGAHASPSVRQVARELGVDLNKVKGSGPKGRILATDVQGWVKEALKPGAQPVGTGGGLQLLAWPTVDFAKHGPIELKPLSKIRKIAGANLARNWVMIPHVTQFDEADITELEAFRVALNKENEKSGVKLTMLTFLLKACVSVLKRYPEFNTSLLGEDLVFKQYFHLGFAADTPNGLVVPVLRNVDQKGILQLAKELADLSAKARDGKLAPAEMQGGTFSISSLGGIGGTAFTPIINAPEVAILGVSKATLKPVWNGEAFVPKLMLPLSLSYDHRVIDGAAAARFTTALVQVLADLRRSLL